ncbi:hypothetical protein Tco_1368043 [Tanacetum coccineum]
MSPIRSKSCTSLAIGERHLPIESTIASISTDVMMAANQTTNNNLIRSILEKEKLNGRKLLDRYHNLRIVLWNKQTLHHLEEALPEAPPATATATVRNAYARRVVEQQEVACLMLGSMTPEIQKNLEDRIAFKILLELKTMFQQQAEQELFKTVKAFHACKQEKGQSVSTYVLKMKVYLDQMDHLGYPMPFVLGVNLILTSLSKDYDQERYLNLIELGASIRRHTRSYYPKRYWELLPKEMLGVITQRETGMSYGKMEGASCTQRKVSMVPFVFSIPFVLSWGGSISSDSLLPSILLLVVINVTVVIVGVVVVVGGVSYILKLSFVIIGFLRRIVFYYPLHQPLGYGNGFLQSLRL